MACYHPLKAFDVGLLTREGKPKYLIRSYDTQSVFDGSKEIFDYIEIPCGKCVGCRLEYSRQWAMRCVLEASLHDHNAFITLTYNDANLPARHVKTDSDGVVTFESPFHSLDKRDFQLFMKRLRKELDKKDIKCRFFACGEYGTKNHRPHLHAIIFGYDFPDKFPIGKNFQGDLYYQSPFLDSIWKKGYALVADVSFDSCAYVARYILKKNKGFSSEIYDELAYEPEFTLCSRKPGIGHDYFAMNKEKIYGNTKFFLRGEKGAIPLRNVRYFDKLYAIEDPEFIESLKQRRRKSASYMQILKESQKSMSFQAHLLDDEKLHLERTKILKERSVK